MIFCNLYYFDSRKLKNGLQFANPNHLIHSLTKAVTPCLFFCIFPYLYTLKMHFLPPISRENLQLLNVKKSENPRRRQVSLVL